GAGRRNGRDRRNRGRGFGDCRRRARGRSACAKTSAQAGGQETSQEGGQEENLAKEKNKKIEAEEESEEAGEEEKEALGLVKPESGEEEAGTFVPAFSFLRNRAAGVGLFLLPPVSHIEFAAFQFRNGNSRQREVLIVSNKYY